MTRRQSHSGTQVVAGGMLDGANQPYSDSNPPESLMLTESATAPSTPGAGLAVMYTDLGGRVWLKNDAGVVYPMTGPTISRNNANVNNSSTTLAKVVAHDRTLQPGTYEARWRGNYFLAATTYGIKLGFSFSGTATNVRANAFISSSATAMAGYAMQAMASGTTGMGPTAGLTTELPFDAWTEFIVTAAGNLTFVFGPSVSGTATIALGSVARVEQIA